MKKTITLRNIFTAVAAVLLFTGCSKDDDKDNSAKLLLTNACPNTPVNLQTLSNGQQIFTEQFYPRTIDNYVSARANGSVNLKMGLVNTSNYVIDTTVALDANKYYSVFAVGAYSSISAAIVKDEFPAAATGKAYIRFFHFSTNAPAVDIAIKNGATLYANRTFNDQSAVASRVEFNQIDIGTYTIQVKLAGTNTVILEVPNVSLYAGKYYTLWARGVVGNTDDTQFGTSLITHPI